MKKRNSIKLILNKTKVSKIGNTSLIYGGTNAADGNHNQTYIEENTDVYDDGIVFSSWCTQETLNTGEVTAVNNTLPVNSDTNP